MPSYNNFKKSNCWSCEYYSGKRNQTHGFILGDFVETDGYGICSCKRSYDYNKKKSDDDYCSYYQRWGVLESLLALEVQKREAAKIEKQQKEELKRIEAEREYQRREIEREREKLERERILSSMSQTEREKFFQKEKEEEENRKARMKQLELEIEEEKRLEKIDDINKSIRYNKVILILVPIISSLITFAVFIPLVITSVAYGFITLGIMVIISVLISIGVFLLIKLTNKKTHQRKRRIRKE